MNRKRSIAIGAFCLTCLVLGICDFSALSTERFAQEPPMLWDEVAVDFAGDAALLFGAVREIVEARYTLTDIDEATNRMETTWLVEKETGGKLRFIIVVEPGVVHVGREIVNPPRRNVAEDVYGSMLYFFLEIANGERDELLADLREGLMPSKGEPEEPED